MVDVRALAVWALGLRRQEPIPDITKLLQYNPDVRSSAVAALEQLGAKEAIQRLSDYYRIIPALVRQSAVEALGKLDASQAIPELVKLFR